MMEFGISVHSFDGFPTTTPDAFNTHAMPRQKYFSFGSMSRSASSFLYENCCICLSSCERRHPSIGCAKMKFSDGSSVSGFRVLILVNTNAFFGVSDTPRVAVTSVYGVSSRLSIHTYW